MRLFFIIGIIINAIFMSITSGYAQSNFKAGQKKMGRVAKAYKEKEDYLKKILSEKNINNASFDLFIRVFKQDKILEVWVKNKNEKKYTHLKDYEICSTSGEPGPKRAMGDYQTPEGVYFIDRFNPTSNFYLSLGVNYPNKSDRILGNKSALGGDIFIHGDCVTIGCVPITDDKIKELYILAIEAKASGQSEIPVHFFPAKMNSDQFVKLKKQNEQNKILISFWDNLQSIFDYFEKNNLLPVINVDNKGAYQLKK